MSTQKAANDLIPPLNPTSAPIVQPRRNVGWGFWLMWTLATAMAWAIGAIIYSIFQFAIVTILAPVLIGLLVLSLGTIVGGLFGGVIGTTFGFTQGLILKQYGYSVRRFSRASLVGGIIGGAMSAVIMCILVLVFAPSLSGPLNAVLAMCIAGGVTGAIVGYKQKPILERQGLEIDPWILISAIGWAVGCITSEIIGQMLYGSAIAIWPLGFLMDGFSPAIVPAILCGVIGGATTGYPLMRAFQQSPIQNPKSEIQNESSSSRVG